jgi:hypothetical protein
MNTLYSSLLRTYTSVRSHVFIFVASSRLPTADVSFPLGSRMVPGLSYQFLTATAQYDWTPAVLSNSLTNQLNWLTNSSLTVLISRHGPVRKHRSSVAVQLLPRKHTCLRSRYLITAVVQLHLSRSPPSNGSPCYNIFRSFLKAQKTLDNCEQLWTAVRYDASPD